MNQAQNSKPEHKQKSKLKAQAKPKSPIKLRNPKNMETAYHWSRLHLLHGHQEYGSKPSDQEEGKPLDLEEEC